MLVLKRKCGEDILLDGGVRVAIVAVTGDRVRVGISAPPGVRADRAEARQRVAAAKATRERTRRPPAGKVSTLPEPSPGGRPMQALSEPRAVRPAPAHHELAADIRGRHRHAIRELRVELHEGGLILSGSAYSYYGKQVAQHEALRRTGLVLLANRVVVEYRAG